ncbi:MAG: two-component system cell cycle response regulator [Phenylobacterium sp.]|jgi:two-component system cell cycle response regulator
MRLNNQASEQQPVVLVVDDTPANLTLMRNMLEPENYKVLLATSGEKALDLLSKIQPDLILLDVMMPGLDGFETIKQIKALPQAKDIPVIFVTAKSDSEDVIQGFAMGAVDYITKPIQRLETLARAKTHLKLRRLLQTERMHCEQIEAIINNISDCVLVVDRHGAIESANPATEHLFGYSEAQLCDKNIAHLLDYDGMASRFIDILRDPENTDPWWRNPCGKSSDNGAFPIEIHVREMITTELSYVVVIQDISLHRNEIDLLHHLTETDPLTNINNRRHFEILLSQSWHQCKRSQQPLSLLFIDIDNFKDYNDHYGHQEGDTSLQQVAAALQKTLPRAVDSVSRYGGEEFVVILPGTTMQGAIQVGENLRASVESLDISHSKSDFGHITISLGIATSNFAQQPLAVPNAKTLLKQADNALYNAKSQGKNRVIEYQQSDS